MYTSYNTAPIIYKDGTTVTFGDFGMRLYDSGSDITFGNFSTADCFHIEKTHLYLKSLSTHGVKSVEFILHRPDTEPKRTMLIEAKKTLATEGATTRSFREEVAEIAQKFRDSLQLAYNIWLGGHTGKVQISANFPQFFERGCEMRLVLVIKERKEMDNTKIADAIQRHLTKDVKMWGTLVKFKVKVLKEHEAVSRKLAIALEEST